MIFYKILHVVIFVILSDIPANIGDAFCYFPLYADSGFLTMQMKLQEGAFGKDAPSFHGERHPSGGITLDFPNTEGVSFPKCQLLLRSYFSYSKLYMQW